MALFWFLTGVLAAMAALVVSMPWLRRNPRYASLPALPWPAGASVLVLLVAVLALSRWLGHADRPGSPLAAAPAATAPAAKFTLPSGMGGSPAAGSAAGLADDAGAMGGAKGGGMSSAAGSGAGSMESAIASLETRLAKGGGSADDWELLAKSYEFLGRPDDAAKARAHQLPPLPVGSGETSAARGGAPLSGAGSPSSATGTAVSGEATLAPALRAKAAAGATLFIVAKSVNSPGAPVAVYRTSVGAWPVKFTLDDSQSMIPGRNLSTAGRVTIEARISQSGQAQPAAGDLKGSSGPIDPAAHQPIKIVIDQILP